MRTTGLFKTAVAEIVVKPNVPFRIVLFGDVHWDSPQHAEDAWTEFLEEQQELNKGSVVHYIGMGDYFDAFSTSERRILRDMHESSAWNFESMAKAKARNFIKQVGFMKFLGLLEGNHYEEFQDGTTSTQYMCQLLRAQYLGVCCALRVKIRSAHSPKSNSCNLDFALHHGVGGGRTIGGSIRRVEDLKFLDAHIYAMGDDHKRFVGPGTPHLMIQNKPNSDEIILKDRATWFARTGSFLRGYVPDQPSYVVDGALPPLSLGGISFIVTLKRDRTGGKDNYSLKINALS